MPNTLVWELPYAGRVGAVENINCMRVVNSLGTNKSSNSNSPFGVPASRNRTTWLSTNQTKSCAREAFQLAERGRSSSLPDPGNRDRRSYVPKAPRGSVRTRRVACPGRFPGVQTTNMLSHRRFYIEKGLRKRLRNGEGCAGGNL